MVLVPRPAGPSQATAPLPGARLSPIEQQPAPDLSGATRAFGQLYEQEQQKANQIAVLDADNQLAQLSTKILYDRSTGILQARGKNALEASQNLPDQWQQGIGDIEKTLTNDAQRLAFRRMAVSRFDDLNTTTERHVDQELRAYDEQTTQAGVAHAYSDAIANAGDPSKVADAIRKQRAIRTDFALRNGSPPELLQQQIAQDASMTHVGVIDRLLANDQDLAAKQYYDAHKADVTGASTIAVERALAEGSTRGESQRQADTITGKAATLGDALTQVRAIADPKVRDATEERVRKFFSEKAEDLRQQRDAGLQRAANLVEQSHDINSVPPLLLSTFTVGERDSLRDYAVKLQKGIPIATDWPTYYQLKSLASAEATQPAFLQTNLLTYRSKLSDEQFKELTDYQASIRAADGRAADRLGGFRTVQQVVNDALGAAGIDATPKQGSSDADKVALFRRSVDEAIAQQEAVSGKKTTAVDAQHLVDDLMVKGAVAGSGIFGFFKTTRHAFEAKPGEDLLLEVKDVPPLDRAQITTRLQQLGQPVTDANILTLYKKRLALLRPAAPQQ